MSTPLPPGGNIALPPTSTRIQVAVSWTAHGSTGAAGTVSALLLDAEGSISKAGDVIGHLEPVTAEGAVSYLHASTEDTFQIDLSRVPTHVDRIAFALALFGRDEAASHNGLEVRTRVEDSQTGAALVQFDFRDDQDTALILAEVYRRGSDWKFRAVGQGYKQGLMPLAEAFGANASMFPPPPPQSVAPVVSPPVSLAKITLDKGQLVSLNKKEAGFGEVRVNLNWGRILQNANAELFRERPDGIDLDLGCLYELTDGECGSVQALGELFGSYEDRPYIQLLEDDRTGDFAKGENLRINGAYWSDIRRVLIYAFIYNGTPNWASANGIVTVDVPDEAPLEVHLDHYRNDRGLCAIAMLENTDGAFHVTKLAEYFTGHRALDTHYKFGLEWVKGHKD